MDRLYVADWPHRSTSPFPRDEFFDGTLSFFREGYAFVANRCRRYRSDAFETRLLLQRVICTQGEDAACMFYTPGRFMAGVPCR